MCIQMKRENLTYTLCTILRIKQWCQLNSSALVTMWRCVIEKECNRNPNLIVQHFVTVWRVVIEKGVLNNISVSTVGRPL